MEGVRQTKRLDKVLGKRNDIEMTIYDYLIIILIYAPKGEFPTPSADSIAQMRAYLLLYEFKKSDQARCIEDDTYKLICEAFVQFKEQNQNETVEKILTEERYTEMCDEFKRPLPHEE